MNKNEQSLREMWDTSEYTTLGVIRVPGESKRSKKKFEEIMAENHKFAEKTTHPRN